MQINDAMTDAGHDSSPQAAQQELFNKALEDAYAKLAEMQKLVSSDDVGKNLRTVRDLLKEYQVP